MKTINKKFDSISGFFAWLSGSTPNGVFKYDKTTYSHLSDYKLKNKSGMYFATESFDAANDLMLHGWHEGAKRVQAAMLQVSGAVNDRPRNYNSVVGFAPNVPNYLAGSPLNMINKKRVRVPARVIDIVYNCSVGYDIAASKIEKNAAKLFNIISGLEKSGIRVNLHVGYFVKTSTEIFNVLVKIKSASQPFNLLKMVYPVVHPSFMRRHMLYCNECSNVTNESFHSSGGTCQEQAETVVAVAGMGVNNKNVFSFYDLDGKTEKQIAEMIK